MIRHDYLHLSTTRHRSTAARPRLGSLCRWLGIVAGQAVLMTFAFVLGVIAGGWLS